MLVAKDKVLVHFDKNAISAYSLSNKALKLITMERIAFANASNIEELLKKIGAFLDGLEKLIGDSTFNNEQVRLYGTGVFQNLNQSEQNELVIQNYVNHGLYFNIVPSDLEEFYIGNSAVINGTKNMMNGLLYQEFRQIVVAGSFQKHLTEIGDVMNVLQKYNVKLLSPWTTKIQPHTIGTDFILLEGQEPLKNERDSWKHKSIHMNKFRQSDAVIVCNPGGTIGKGTMLELGYMVAINKRIIFTEPPSSNDPSLLFPYEVGLNF